MSGQVLFTGDGPIALVILSHPGKLNAMSRAMWRELRRVFEKIQSGGGWRCVLVHGEEGGTEKRKPEF